MSGQATTDNVTCERLLISFVPTSTEDSDRLASQLLEGGGVGSATVEVNDDAALTAETVLMIVTLGPIGLAVLTRLVDWFRDRNDCLLVVDTRGSDLKIEERCDIVGRRGQVIVITGPDEQVVIHRNEAFLDLQALVTAAIGKSAEAVRSLASASGARAEIENRSKGP